MHLPLSRVLRSPYPESPALAPQRKQFEGSPYHQDPFPNLQRRLHRALARVVQGQHHPKRTHPTTASCIARHLRARPFGHSPHLFLRVVVRLRKPPSTPDTALHSHAPRRRSRSLPVQSLVPTTALPSSSHSIQLRKEQAGLNVIRLKPSVPPKDGLLVISSRKHGQDVFYGQPTSSNHRLATENARYNNDPIEKLTPTIYMCHSLRPPSQSDLALATAPN